MAHKVSEELKNDQIRYKYFDFHKLHPQNGIARNSSTKFKSVRNAPYKKLVVPETIDLSETIYANSKFMTEEVPKYVDENNSKKYLRSLIYNLNNTSSETDQENTPGVNKKQTEKISGKVYNAEPSKIKSPKLKSKITDHNSRDPIKNPTKPQLSKHIKKKEHNYAKPFNRTKNLVENLRDDKEKGQTTNRQTLYSYYDDKIIRVIKKPNSTNEVAEPSGQHKAISCMEKQINGYIEKLIRKFEDSPNDEVSPYSLPKRRNTHKNYKSKTTIVTPAGTNNESYDKFNSDKKNSQQNETSIVAKAKLFWQSSKRLSKNNVDCLNPKTASKPEPKDDYLPCTSPPITNSRNFAKNTVVHVKSKIAHNQKNRDDILPRTSSPTTNSKNIFKNKEDRIRSKTTSKTEQNEANRDEFLPYTSPPIIKSKSVSHSLSKTERNNKSTKQNPQRKTSSIEILAGRKKNSLEETKATENKVSKSEIEDLSKIIASETILHAIKQKLSDGKCSIAPQKKLSKIKELIKVIANEGSGIENETLDSMSSVMIKTQLSEIKELIQAIANEGSLHTIEKKSSDNKIKLFPKVAETLHEIDMEQLNKKEKCTPRRLLPLFKPKRALSIVENSNIVNPRPMKSISWTSLVAAQSRLDVTKINHRIPKSYICPKRRPKHKHADLKHLKQKLNYVQTKKSSLTLILSYKDTKFHISSSVFHTSISVPSIKINKTSSSKNDFIVKSNSRDSIKLVKLMNTNLNQTKNAVQPLQVDFNSVVQLFVPDKKFKTETVNGNKRTTEKLNKTEGKTVVLCQRRPEYWWVRAHMRNGSKNAKKCNCEYCKTMSKYLPQIENSLASITTVSEISANESSETASLDVDTFSLVNSSYENLVKIDPLYTKLMADTKQNKLAQLLKYEPHTYCYLADCEICRNTLQNIAYCRTNRSETDLNLISKLKDHKHEISCTHDFDIKRSSLARKNIFRKIKLSTTRILTKHKRVEVLKEIAPKKAEVAPKKAEVAHKKVEVAPKKAEDSPKKVEDVPVGVKTIATEAIIEKKKPQVSPKMPLQHKVSISKKPALKGGDMKLINSENITSTAMVKKNDKKASMTIFAELRNVFTMFVSFNIKILDFITFGKLNVFSK